jgi:hypothetical protein
MQCPFGVKRKCSLRADVFRFGPNNGHRSIGSACLFCAPQPNSCSAAKNHVARLKPDNFNSAQLHFLRFLILTFLNGLDLQ